MSEWSIRYDQWVPEDQPLRESLSTLGNGYFATRGAFEESKADELNYPGTYLGGGYNRLVSSIYGEQIENEDLVNWPNWLTLSYRHHPDDNWFDLSQIEVINFEQELDLKQAQLCRKVHFRDSSGRETMLFSKRFVSMANPHIAALSWELTPLNWFGAIEIKTALDGRVTNSGVARYKALANQHLEALQQGQHNTETIYLLVQTIQSNIRMAQAARTELFLNDTRIDDARETKIENGYVEQIMKVLCTEGVTLRVEKVVQLHTSRDKAITEPLQETRKNIDRQGSFDHLLKKHSLAWERLWNRCDLELACNNKAQSVLRLHIFHLLQTVSANTVGLDVGVPARGLHGEAYRGHIFWDEIFVFPFLNLRLPELTRELLSYRFRRLPEARFAASQAGYRGAMFPWQSGSNGREESQVIHLNPKSGRWLPDNTFLQRHISAAVAYNVWQYYQATEDMEFLSFLGAEMILDIALFWSTIAEYNVQRDRYEIRHVVGPDEYHTSYPDSKEPGLNNNAYTNLMAVWVIHRALQLCDILDSSRITELFQKLNISADDKQKWSQISKKMYVPFIKDSEIIAQFEGYDDLAEFPWETYKAKYSDSMRLDRILESEGKDVNRYKASKQADVLMLFYLFSSEELLHLLEQLNYSFKPENILANIAYYEARTSHGSTLSKVVHSWVLARSDRKRAWKSFEVALVSDLEDIQGSTTQEGIHLGAMAGTVDLVQRCFTGLEIRDNVLWLNPVLPIEISCLNFQIRYRSHWLSIYLTKELIRISVDISWSKEVLVGVKGEVHTLYTGDKKEFGLEYS